MFHNIDMVDIDMDINMAFIESVTDMYSLLKILETWHKLLDRSPIFIFIF